MLDFVRDFFRFKANELRRKVYAMIENISFLIKFEMSLPRTQQQAHKIIFFISTASFNP
jgi:hypothetical protein